MRVKELNNKLAHVCWSPYDIYPSYIACGTAAEQLDGSFGTNSVMELLKLDLSDSKTELDVAGSISTESRFSKLIWGTHSSGNSKNLLVGGCENSKIYLYDYEKILSQKSSESVVKTLENHTGSVAALDLNPFQNNLLASGASSSEILIWDLNNSAEPMTPGAKIQPADDINCVAWNNQVQHILASTCSGKCVVWDLRKNESIIKVSDNMSKMKAKLVAWHPDIATQMCLSSEEDNSPYLQIWDLRFATSPVRILEGHQRGILNFCWCPSDSNLLISSSKDNRIICWNPNNATTNGEILYELPTSGQWCFDVAWSQRNLDLICASSFESQINVYSLMGGKYNIVHQTSSKIMDSFGVDSNPNQQPTEVHKQTTQVIPQLKIAPKWMKRTCGATFGFGGKLVQFGKNSSDGQQENQKENQKIVISQVVTDPELIDKAQYLESVLNTGNLREYCNYKIEIANNENESTIWRFIMATFYEDKKNKFLQLLDVKKDNEQESEGITEDNKTDFVDGFENINLSSKERDIAVFDELGNNNLSDNNIYQSKSEPIQINFVFEDETDQAISESLVLGDYEKVVNLCVKQKRFTDAILIASAFDQTLLEKTKKIYFENNKSQLSKLLEGVLNRDWMTLVSSCNLNHWKKVLATIMTYTTNEETVVLCDQLGHRLEQDSGIESNLLNACICYIFSSNIDGLIHCWEKLNDDENKHTSTALQDLIEKVMALKHSFTTDSNKRNERFQSSDRLSAKLSQYAKLLTDQGCFLSAYNYINDSNDSSIRVMKERIYNVLDPSLIQKYKLRKPDYSFQTVNSSLQNRQRHSSLSRTGSYPSPTVHTPVSRGNSYSSNSPSLNQNNHQNVNSNSNILPANNSTPPSDLYARQGNPMNLNQHNINQGSSKEISNPALFTPSLPPTNTGQSVLNNVPQMTSYMHTKATTGWNDPPMIAPKVKQPVSNSNPSEMPAFFQPTMPTMPTMPNMPNMSSFPTIPTIPTMSMPNSMPQTFNHLSYQNPMENLNSKIQPDSHNPMFQSNIQNNNPTQQQNLPQSRPASVQQEKIVEKGPLPAEHQNIKTVFDTLLNKCMNSSTTPVVKRKLDDVSKKLDVLYDKLRVSSLSDNVVIGLNSMIQHVQINDYPTTLSLHSQIVAHSNFSEISGFMPGIKVLIQSCQQLGATFK